MTRSYGVNGLNQYTAAGPQAIGYDARGNLTSWNGETYAYTSDNQFTGRSVSSHPSNWANYGYDPFGRLFNENVTGKTNLSLQYDGSRLIAESNANTDVILRRYVHGPGTDEPIIWYEGAGTSDRRFLHADERGSIVAVTNNAGTVTAINTYDDYGIPGSANDDGRFKYTGQTLTCLSIYLVAIRVA